MALWNKLQTELDRFGRAAQSAFDEGKARLEILRVRQLADKAAQALGYAMYNARKEGGELDAESYARLSSTLAAHEAEAERLEAQMDAARAARAETMGEEGGPSSGDATGSGATGGPTDTGGTSGAGGSSGTAGGVDPAMGDMGGGGSSTPGGSGSGASGAGPGSSGYGTGTPPYSGPPGGGSPSW